MRSIHEIIVGKVGPAYKTSIFKENEFKKELAPSNAKIEHIEMKNEKFVKMTYNV
ncbi:hypothetical protein PVA17_24275 [Lysinibacillus sp. CNPSo 3705]|uniref:hypothetical protein n=1 Tax=Lysinibacillus sp. CNPSo 3705 TaxID=3028148 RepID=UPI002363978F|nr:hypothetical protein [Lysinibacillus sp. CNPSo 3705]MDD1505835.1 hypothetical protein [Lysinibacillus sp. CNPSo 3705]